MTLWERDAVRLHTALGSEMSVCICVRAFDLLASQAGPTLLRLTLIFSLTLFSFCLTRSCLL